MWKLASIRVLALVLLNLCSSIVIASPSVEAGLEHSVVLKADGSVWAWGENYNGQLGNGSTDASENPVRVNSLSNVSSISAGGYHNIALLLDGSVWAWGSNFKGQVGNGTIADSLEPVKVDGLNNVIAIASGMYHSIALQSDGSVLAWGDNSHGQLGDGSFVDSYFPSLVSTLTGITEISTGYWHNYVLDNSGKVWQWGYNLDGPPITSDSINFSSPVEFAGEWSDVVLRGLGVQEIILPDNTTVLVAGSLENRVMMRPDGVVLETLISPSSLNSSSAIQSATEVRWTGELIVNISPVEAMNDGLQWRVGSSWHASGERIYLPEGNYSIEFSGSDKWLAPDSVDVHINAGGNQNISGSYTALYGEISVSLEPPHIKNQAQWRINGGAWQASGAVVNHLIPSEYTIEYLSFDSWQVPAPETVTIEGNQTVSLIAEYEEKLASIIVHLGPEGILSEGGQWRLNGGRWYSGEVAMVTLPTGNYTLEFSPVSNWNAPQNLAITLGSNGLLVSASYAGISDYPVLVAEIGLSTEAVNNEEDIVDNEPVAEETIVDNYPVLDDVIVDADKQDNVYSPQPDEELADVDLSLDLETVSPTVLEIGEKTSGFIDYIGDFVVYEFKADMGQRYLFNSAGRGDLLISIYDDTGVLVDSQEGTESNAGVRYVWRASRSASYYAKIEFNNGWSVGNVGLKVSLQSVNNDFNGDGIADVLALFDEGSVSLMYINEGEIQKKVVAEYKVGDNITGGWKVRAIGDFDGDHKSDILWRAETGETAIWIVNESGQLNSRSGITSELVGGLTAWKISHTGDFNGDGRSDVLWRHQNSGQIALWFMDGLEVMETSGLVAAQAGNPDAWSIEGIGDFNADGKSDILWRHRRTGRTAEWLMDGLEHSEFSGLTSDYVSHASRWSVLAIDDFDGDSRSDLLWRNANNGYLFIWFMDSNEVVDSGYITNHVDVESAWEIVQVGDFDGDGKADLLWQDKDSHELHTWLMSGLNPVGNTSVFDELNKQKNYSVVSQ